MRRLNNLGQTEVSGGTFQPGSWSVPAANDWQNSRMVVGGLETYALNTYPYLVSKNLIDINGDGLPDLVSSRAWSRTCLGGTTPGYQCAADSGCQGGSCVYQWDVWLNTGRGFESKVAWPAPPFSSVSVNSPTDAYPLQDGGTGVTRALRDMNGDGLPDYVDATFNPWRVYLNTGAGFKTDWVPWGGRNGPISTFTYPGEVMVSDVFDVNGDGIADYVYGSYSPADAPYSALLGTGSGGSAIRPNLLVREDNGLGASWEVTYVPSTDPATAGSGCVGGVNVGKPCLTDSECPGSSCTSPCSSCSELPFNTWVVRTLTTHSGFSGPGNDLTTQYTFTGGYFDPVGRQFRGFRQSLETRTADGKVVRRQYAAPPFATSTSPAWPATVPARPFKLIDEQVLDSSGKPLTDTAVDWGTTDLGSGRVQVHPTKRVETTYSTDGSGSQKTRTEVFNTYDSFNNPTSTTVSGSDVSSVTTMVTYLASALCPGNPTRVVVSDDSNHTDLSEKDFAYDAKCNLTAIQARLAPSGQSATTGALITTTALEYDNSAQSPDAVAAKTGQPTRILDARGAAAAPQYGTTLNYACSNRIFACTITNALGQQTVKQYDLRWGKPSSVRDPNGNTTTFAYDGLGRLKRVTRPLDSLPWVEYSYRFAAGAGTPSWINTTLREPASDLEYRQVYTFYDGLGRALETKRDGGGQEVIHLRRLR
jgi:YD repeat-containing protein